MADDTTKPDQVASIVQIPGLQPVAVVAVRLPNGEIALRHASELQKVVPAAPAEEVKP